MRAALPWLAALAVACGGDGKKNDKPASGDSADRAAPVTAAAGQAIGQYLNRNAATAVLFIGTSLTAGLGLDPDSAFPAIIKRMADSINLRLDVTNSGLSGETTAGLLRRVAWLLTAPASYVVLETGANDGLRGLDVDSTRGNIEAIIRSIREVKPGAFIFLIQMEAPPNMGEQYAKEFHAMYTDISKSNKVWLVPFLLEGVAGVRDLNQADGIHPNEKGERIVARNIWRSIGPVIVPGLRVR